MKYILLLSFFLSLSAHGLEDWNAATKVDVEELRDEVAKLKKQVALLEASLQLIIDSSPELREKCVAELKRQQERDRLAAIAQNQKMIDGTIIAAIHPDGIKITMKDGSVYNVRGDLRGTVQSRFKVGQTVRIKGEYMNEPVSNTTIVAFKEFK